MVREMVCPECGVTIVLERTTDGAPANLRTVELAVPATRSDDAFPAIDTAGPQGEPGSQAKWPNFVLDAPPPPLEPIPAREFAKPNVIPTERKSTASGDLLMNPPADPLLDELASAAARASKSTSGDILNRSNRGSTRSDEGMVMPQGLDLEGARLISTPGSRNGSSDDDVEFDPEPANRRSAWPVALLASYASAMTLACFWLWGTNDRTGNPPTADRPGFPIEESYANGTRKDRSALVEPLAMVPDHHRTRLGQSLRIGDLEIIPRDVVTGPVRLRRARVDGRVEHRDGGSEALLLRLRLRNVSDRTIFAPLDEAFVRDRDRGLPDTFLETRDGERIYCYKLPVLSEWEIVGQRFEDLRPGEALDALIVSDTEAYARARDELSWRVRLRAGPDRLEDIAVEFHADEIRESPSAWY